MGFLFNPWSSLLPASTVHDFPFLLLLPLAEMYCQGRPIMHARKKFFGVLYSHWDSCCHFLRRCSSPCLLRGWWRRGSASRRSIRSRVSLMIWNSSRKVLTKWHQQQMLLRYVQCCCLTVFDNNCVASESKSCWAYQLSLLDMKTLTSYSTEEG